VTTDKPSRNEEEYFAKREAEILKERRQSSAEEARVAERQSHFGKCPKCGADLGVQDYHGVQVDRCPECHGIWFDAGETEGLLKREDAGLVNVFRSILRGVGGR
jgi:uncharacterized protein